MKTGTQFTFLICLLFVPQMASASDMSGLFIFYALIAIIPFAVIGPVFGLIAFQFVPDESEKELTHPTVITGVLLGYIVCYIITALFLESA